MFQLAVKGCFPFVDERCNCAILENDLCSTDDSLHVAKSLQRGEAFSLFVCLIFSYGLSAVADGELKDVAFFPVKAFLFPSNHVLPSSFEK